MSYEKSRIVIMFFVIVFALNVLIASEPYNNKVIAITDGDTIKVLVNNEEIKIRLAGIDAPEKNQPFGTKAKEHLAKLCFNKNIVFYNTKRDRYGRVLSKIYINDIDICAEMVKSGMAWQYTDYNKSIYLKELQEKAKLEKRGLWIDKDPIPPWKWRKDQYDRRRNKTNKGKS